MKYYIKFINGKCFIEAETENGYTRKSLSIQLNDKDKQRKLRRKLIRLIENERINPLDTCFIKARLIELIIDN